MNYNLFYDRLKARVLDGVCFLLPLMLLIGMVALLHYHVSSLLPLHHFILLSSLLIGAVVVAFLLHHANVNKYVVYGLGFGGVLLLYAEVYSAFMGGVELDPLTFFRLMIAIGGVTGYVAVRFHGRLLASLAIGMSAYTPFIFLSTLSRSFIAWYFIFLMFVALCIAYYRRWFEVALLAFVGFLFYNPFLFSYTDLEGKKGFLSIYDVIDFMMIIFGMYTIIPWFYSICCAKKRIFEAVSLSLSGAYTAALIHYVVGRQIYLVKQLPFFIRFFVQKDVPRMYDLHMYLFTIYGAIYALLFLLMLLFNRQAKVLLSTCANLALICAAALIYVEAQEVGIMPSVYRAKRNVEELINTIHNR